MEASPVLASFYDTYSKSLDILSRVTAQAGEEDKAQTSAESISESIADLFRMYLDVNGTGKYEPLREHIRIALRSLPANVVSEKVVSALLAAARSKQKITRLAAIELLGEIKATAPEVVQLLTDLAQSAGIEMVKVSVTALCRIGQVSPEALTAIVHALEITTIREDWKFRETALAALESWARHDADARAKLQACLSSPCWHVEMEAAATLIQIGAWTPELYDCIARHLHNSEWRFAMSGALARCDALPPELVSNLFELAEQNVSRADYLVPEVLGKQGKNHSDIVDRLLISAQDKSWSKEARCIMLKALGKTEQARLDVVEALLAILRDEEFIIRLYAVEALGQIGAGGNEVVWGLLNVVSDDNQYMRRNAVVALGKCGDAREEVKQVLLTMLRQDQSILVVKTIPTALQNLCLQDEETLHALLTVLQTSASQFSHYAEYAAKALGAWKEIRPEITTALREAVEDQKRAADVRQAAVRALTRYQPDAPETLKALQTASQDKYSAPLRGIAVEALEILPETDASESALLAAAQDAKSGTVRRAAITALGKRKQVREDALHALFDLAKQDAKADVRCAAIEALSRLCLNDALPTRLGVEPARHAVITALYVALEDKGLLYYLREGQYNRVRDAAWLALWKLCEAEKTFVTPLDNRAEQVYTTKA